MAVPTDMRGDFHFHDDVTFAAASQLSLPDGTVDNAAVAADADIAATKLKHRRSVDYAQANGTDVTSETKLLHIFKSAATLIAVQVRPATAPTGGDKQYTVDLHRGTNGGAPSTVLSAAITMSSADSDNTLEAGTLSATAMAAGDALVAVVTASGSTGSQGQGFVLTVTYDEDP